MYGRLVYLGSDVDTTCSEHKRVCLAKRIVQIEPLKVNVCCCDWDLPKHELFPETVDEVGEEDGDNGELAGRSILEVELL